MKKSGAEASDAWNISRTRRSSRKVYSGVNLASDLSDSSLFTSFIYCKIKNENHHATVRGIRLWAVSGSKRGRRWERRDRMVQSDIGEEEAAVDPRRVCCTQISSGTTKITWRNKNKIRQRLKVTPANDRQVSRS
jgi:hypothetical protein